ncbi:MULTISPECIES: tyrosine-type recombinase/integrase [Bradyrhizobium]|uniref:tyrosine-type recombinase/integrase n=1 Tax=Bradyrhizobium TaxID=374 RepID=UPI002013B7EE|nr:MULTISPECIES: tyrosine-type recombinase/integrase [Bradyrhizobium]
MGFEYIEADALAKRETAEILKRVEKLLEDGHADDPDARAALLGAVPKPAILVSDIFVEYERQVAAEMTDMSPNQRRRWANERKLAVKYLIKVIGDKPVNRITGEDALDFSDWWRDRVQHGTVSAKTANKGIGNLSRMLKVINRRHRLGLPDVFSGMRLDRVVNRSREPFDVNFIQNSLLEGGTLMGLNPEARRTVFLIAETGLRLSEAINLTRETIQLDCEVPHVQVRPDGRRMKTEQSRRDIPLVGVALEAMKLQPNGFPQYRDKNASLSAVLNKFLETRNLRTERKLTIYSLRHSFKDRLIAAEAPDSIIDELMGHKTYKPKYGRGATLDLKQKWLLKIALRAPATL